MTRTWLDFLKEEFDLRRKDDPDFSLRAFARLVGVAPSTLSSILSGRRRITLNTASKFAENCEWTPDRKSEFLKLTVGEGASTIVAARTDNDFRLLNEDELEKISHWQHYAILSLAHLPHCLAEPEWIAARLNISSAVAASTLQDLTELGLVERRGHLLRRRSRFLRTRTDVPQQHVRRLHTEIMQKGLASLEADAVNERDITAITMPVNSRRLKLAKQKIKDFRRHLMDFLSSGPKDSVYAMQISLVPLARPHVFSKQRNGSL